MIENGKEMLPPASWRPDPDDKPFRSWRLVLLFSLVAVAYQLAAHFTNYRDYIGPDPDDSMRLVEVRDFLAGQGWFDLRQYRLGPDGGTLMHWSRLIDLPIAALITFFSHFLSPRMAEMAATTVWPVLLILPLFASTALAAYRIGGRSAVPISLALGIVYFAAIVRFRPGAIDHHNVQLVLVIFITAMLLDPLARPSNFAAAGVACAAALAIGAETTPLVAVVAMAVAMLWAMHGEHYRRAAVGFGLAFALASAALFLATTPPRLYTMVTCDTLSIGFSSLAVTGGIGLAVASWLLRGGSGAIRFLSLAVIGALVGTVALAVAPECLGNPLDELDPILKTMWLSSIGEAQSVISELKVNPEAAGGFYAVGFLGLVVCAARIMSRRQVTAYSVLFVLIALSWLVTLVQVRGAIFSNYLAFVPLAALIADLRDLYRSRSTDKRAALAFVLAVLASVPSVWTLGGILILNTGNALAGTPSKADEELAEKTACLNQKSVSMLSALPAGRVLSTSNSGSALLRFTPHSVLTANYHRNQAGMIEALRISMASPGDAIEMMRRDKVAYVVICTDDAIFDALKNKAPDGFFSRLLDGDVPEFLEPVEHGGEARLKIFRVLS